MDGSIIYTYAVVVSEWFVTHFGRDIVYWEKSCSLWYFGNTKFKTSLAHPLFVLLLLFIVAIIEKCNSNPKAFTKAWP